MGCLLDAVTIRVLLLEGLTQGLRKRFSIPEDATTIADRIVQKCHHDWIEAFMESQREVRSGVPLPRPAALEEHLKSPVEDWPYLDEGTLLKTRSRSAFTWSQLAFLSTWTVVASTCFFGSTPRCVDIG